MRVTDTSKDEPLMKLLNAMGGIERQEAAGQQQLAASSQLPTDGLSHPALAMIVVTGRTPRDPLFSDVVLPDGWKIAPTEHSMWSHLVDEHGRKRAGVFYKAAFYDRRAHIHPIARYTCGRDYEFDGGSRFIVRDTATGELLFVTEPTPDPACPEPITREEYRRRADMERPNEQAARTWITARFPNWQDPAAYWDEPSTVADPTDSQE